MTLWKNKNKEFRKVLDERELEEALGPFRVEIQRVMGENKNQNVKMAYRETRAMLLSQLRVNLALLDAAAHEENILIKK